MRRKRSGVLLVISTAVARSASRWWFRFTPTQPFQATIGSVTRDIEKRL